MQTTTLGFCFLKENLRRNFGKKGCRNRAKSRTTLTLGFTFHNISNHLAY